MPLRNSQMKDNIDLYAVLIGMVGSLLKGLKHKLKLRQLIITMLSAGILAFGTIGLLELFFSDLEPKILIVASFAVGWVANELTDVLDDVVRDSYDLISAYLKNRFSKKK